MLTEPTEDVIGPWSIRTVIHTRDNNGGITVYLVSGSIKGQTQTSIVDPSEHGQLDRNRYRFDHAWIGWLEMIKGGNVTCLSRKTESQTLIASISFRASLPIFTNEMIWQNHLIESLKWGSIQSSPMIM